MDKSSRPMARTIAAVSILIVLLSGLSVALTAQAQAGAHVDVLTVNGAIDTWVDGYVHRGISRAEQDGAEALVIVLNTPGGALNAMQNITVRMLNARVPVVVFVYPAGAWAGSAGTFVALAANVAAMAPGTSIGAAHPVDASGQNIPTDERLKITNLSMSIIRSIAQQRGRNPEWAARAVQDSVAATAQEALDQKVIDLMADNLNDLVNKIDGMSVKTAAGEVTMHTRRAGLVDVGMNVPEGFFHGLVDPTVALILLQIGFLALAAELYNPGATVPGVVGAICLVLAFVALGNLPVNWGGIALIVLSVVAFVVDVKVNSLVLTAGGLVMFVLGAFLLFTPFSAPSPLVPSLSVSPVVVLALGGIMAAFFVFVLGAAVRGRRYPILSGPAALVGAIGYAASDLGPRGVIQVKSELWTAVAEAGPIPKGAPVRVVGMDGLSLRVVAQPDSGATPDGRNA